MNTRIIAIANHKGGVGKTTTTASLGSILSRAGLRVLLLDLDAQCNLTDTFIGDDDERRDTIYTLFTERRAVIPIRVTETLDIIPANLDMSALDIMVGGQFEKELILSDVLSEMHVKEHYDIVLLDCPPSLGLVTVNALVAANEVFVPITPEYYPLKGLVKLEEICARVAGRLNPGIGITGVIITRYNPTKRLMATIDEKLREKFGDKVFGSRIRENIRLAECPMSKRDITQYAPGSNGAKDYVELAKEIIAKLETKEN